MKTLKGKKNQSLFKKRWRKRFLQSKNAAPHTSALFCWGGITVTSRVLRRTHPEEQHLCRWCWTPTATSWLPNPPSMEWHTGGRQREGKRLIVDTHMKKRAQSSMGSPVLQRANKPQPGHESREREHVFWLVARLYLRWPWAAHSWCQPVAVVTLERPSLPVKQHSWLDQGGFASQGAPRAACAAQMSTGWGPNSCPACQVRAPLPTLTTNPCISSGQEWQHRTQSDPAWTDTLWAPHSSTPRMDTKLVCPKTPAVHSKF